MSIAKYSESILLVLPGYIVRVCKNCSFLFQEAIYIGGAPDSPLNLVYINDCVVRTGSAAETISVFIASYICFNLVHSKRQESVLEALEGLLSMRKNFLSAFVKKFVNSF